MKLQFDSRNALLRHYQTLRQHYLLWLLPTITLTLLAGVFCTLRPRTWKASQALLVRDEAHGTDKRQGRFDNIEAMKTAQETIVEIAKNQAVVAAALREVARSKDIASGAASTEPGADEVESLQAALTVTAPKGAEFGRTEVIYLSVTGSSPDQAVARAAAVCDQLQGRLNELRGKKAHSVIAELENGVVLAAGDLQQATAKLEAIETQVGSDLGELRILSDSGAGDSNLRASLTQIKNELRQLESRRDAQQQQQSLLEAAQQDANRLVATSNQLLESQPSLRRLKEGLVDAQLRTAQLQGKMSTDHPEVRAAVDAETAVRKHLHAELELALRGLIADRQVTDSQLLLLERQQADIDARLNRLASVRARYSNQVAEVRHCSETLQKAQKDLADARATQAAAQSTSLLTRLDGPVAGNSPLGPGNLVILLTGLGGGLSLGLGLLFLRSPLARLSGRRWNDCVEAGRRASDFVMRRRASDAQQNPTGKCPEKRDANDRRASPPRRQSEPLFAPTPPASNPLPATATEGFLALPERHTTPGAA